MFQALHAGCLSAFAPATRVNGEAALSPGVCDPISIPYVRAVCCSNLQKSSHSRKYSQHIKEFQSKCELLLGPN